MSNDIKAKVTADISEFNTGMAKVQNVASSVTEHFKKQFGSLQSSITNAFAVGAVVAFVRTTISEFARIGDIADQFDTTGESIQRLKYAAEQSGTTVEVLASALAKGNKAAQEAKEGSDTASKAFSDLGISAEEYIKLSPEEQTVALAKAFTGAEDKGKAFNALLTILGKSAKELLPLLRSGGEGVKGMFASAPILDEKTLDQLKKADDFMNRMLTTAKVLGGYLVTAFVPFAEAITIPIQGFILSLLMVKDLLNGDVLGATKRWGAFLENIRGTGSKFAALFSSVKSLVTGEPNSSTADSKPVSDPTADGTAETPKTKQELTDAQKLADLKSKNDDAVRKAQREQMALDTQRAIKLGEIEEARRQGTVAQTELEREQAREKAIQLVKELKAIDEKIAKEKEAEKKASEDKLNEQNKADKKQYDEFKKFQDAKKKKDLETQKKKIEDEVKSAEKNLDLAKALPFNPAVDSLRQSGGGVAGVDYSNNIKSSQVTKEEAAKKELEKSNDKLQKIIDKLEAITQVGSDGSGTLD